MMLNSRLLAVLTLCVALWPTFAGAAPLWLERKFIPAPQLIDPRFAQASETPIATVDHSAWELLLERYVIVGDDGINRVQYAGIKALSQGSLNAYLQALEAIDTAQLTRQQQLAFWINVYNAATVRLIVEHYPLESIRNIKVGGAGPWDHPVVTVLGRALTLGEIEHHIVRALFPDPRIHYALNCASIGCPNLAAKAYRANTLETMLSDAATAYVNHARGVQVRKGRANISKIYGWYREDFGADEAAVLTHINQYAQGTLKRSLLAISKIGKYDYDWLLNDAAATSPE